VDLKQRNLNSSLKENDFFLITIGSREQSRVNRNNSSECCSRSGTGSRVIKNYFPALIDVRNLYIASPATSVWYVYKSFHLYIIEMLKPQMAKAIYPQTAVQTLGNRI
jgi:hypothetical protein